MAAGDRTSQLLELSMPTLVVHGDGDLFVAPDGGSSLAATVPSAEHAVVAGMGHMVFDPPHIDSVAALVGDFVTDIEHRSQPG